MKELQLKYEIIAKNVVFYYGLVTVIYWFNSNLAIFMVNLRHSASGLRSLDWVVQSLVYWNVDCLARNQIICLHSFEVSHH